MLSVDYGSVALSAAVVIRPASGETLHGFCMAWQSSRDTRGSYTGFHKRRYERQVLVLEPLIVNGKRHTRGFRPATPTSHFHVSGA